MNADGVIQELRAKLAQVPGINVFMQNPPLIRVGGRLTKALYQYSLQDTDVKELFHWAPILMDKMAADKAAFQDVTSDLQIANPQVNVEIDRDKAAALGVTPQQIENALYDAFGEKQSSTIYTDVAEYWVVFEVEPQFQLDPAALARLYLTSSFTGTNGTPQARAVERRRQTHAQPRADDHFARRPIAGGHHFLQSSAGRVVEHGRRANCKKSKAICTCPRPSPAAFKAPPQSFNRPNADWSFCSSWPFSSFTSSSEFFTKVSSIR